MRLSARNVLKAKVVALTPGAVNTEVVLRLEAPADLVAIITKASARKLGLAEGKTAYAIIKASSLVIGAD